MFCENAIKTEPGDANDGTNIVSNHRLRQLRKTLPKTEPMKVNFQDSELNWVKLLS
ncbi:hypothetical protein D3C84_546370 [compost metagenome]